MTPTPSTDKTVAEAMERAAFEAWAEPQGFNIDREYDDADGFYHRVSTRWAWLAWQARAAAPAESAAMPEGQPEQQASEYVLPDKWNSLSKDAKEKLREDTLKRAHAREQLRDTVLVAAPAAVKTKGKDDSPSGEAPWCACEPTLCHGVGRCRWHAMNYSPFAAPQTAAPAAEPEVQYKITVIDNDHPDGIPLEQWQRKAAPAAEPVPVGWFDRKELAELKHANGMDIWAESHSIWGPGMRADPAVHASHLVPLYTAAPPTAAQSDEARDAARYRWLRAGTTAGNGYPRQEFRLPKVPKRKGTDLMRGSIAQHLDAAVDAAIAIDAALQQKG